MVTGPEDGLALAARQGLSALYLMREDNGSLRARGRGSPFAE